MKSFVGLAVAIAVLLAAGFSAGFSAQRDAHHVFRLANTSPSGWTFSFEAPRRADAQLVLGGQPYIQLEGWSTSASAPSGFPHLPAHVLSLGVPEGTHLKAELVDPVFGEDESLVLAPEPRYSYGVDREAVEEYIPDREVYVRDTNLPAELLSIGDAYRYRQQRIATIRLVPYRYNPARRLLRRLLRATVKVSLVQDAPSGLQAVQTSASDEPWVEEVYKSLLDNYSQAKMWRTAQPTSRPSRTGASEGWFELGKTYLRIPIFQDGWYSISPRQLEAAGVNWKMLDTSTVKLFAKGVEIPLAIHSDSLIQFYALQKYGDSSYVDPFTDTNTYWLTWGGTSGKRFSPVQNISGSNFTEVRSSVVTRHFEQNTDYYEGTFDYEYTDNGQVPGEGWVWKYFYPGTSELLPFLVDTIDVASGPTARLRVQMWGTTRPYQAPDHRARFWINDSLAGEIGFDGRAPGVLDVAFPARWLKNGANQLRITSIATSSPVNQFYVDWFELDYRRFHRAAGDQFVCTFSRLPGTDPTRLWVYGLVDSVVRLYDQTAARTLAPSRILREANGMYSLAFDDSAAGEHLYVVASRTGVRRVSNLSPKVFSNIRQNPRGADYIVVTHRLFRSAADRLALHREAHNKVRAKVVDVQDIYDEFNFGVMNTASIKAFLRYAYEQWPGARPSVVVFLGDASWDFHRYMPTAVMTNYVPAYGVPSGDNWYVCFDTVSTCIPFMQAGRLPVQDSVQAEHLVAKLIGYDSYQLGAWNKTFLFVDGGNDDIERTAFDAATRSMIGTSVLPPPIGGTPIRIDKTTPAVIDGEHKAALQAYMKEGLIFYNFLGHSGGRFWGVDLGNPNDLENVNGRLPLVTSVSCNVGAFADPNINVLSEELVRADGRGAIAVWASAAIGYANLGATLVQYLLQHMGADSTRGLGALTTSSLLRLWQQRGSDFITRAMLNLNPLQGDPLTSLAIPLKPDLAVEQSDISFSDSVITVADSAVTVKCQLHNFGLVPNDSVGLRFLDTNAGTTTTVLDTRIRPPYHVDSLYARWLPRGKAGTHRLSVAIDPAHVIDEVQETNNGTTVERYVYANEIAVIRPLPHSLVDTKSTMLVVSQPVGWDSLIYTFRFELDTVSSFDSPFLMKSGATTPSPVAGAWSPPRLDAGQQYYWRARAEANGVTGTWSNGTFRTTDSAMSPSVVRWAQQKRGPFNEGTRTRVVATDTGLTIAPSSPTFLYARSVGSRANADKDFYSIFRLGDQIFMGYWWHVGSSFMVLRVNDFTSEYVFKSFDVASQAGQADSMAAFIAATPPGNYLAITVLFDGRTNVSSTLRAALRQLGSRYMDSLYYGYAWMLIGRKGVSGPAMQPIEQWSKTGIAADSLFIQNVYSAGSGYYRSPKLPIPRSLGSFGWQTQQNRPQQAIDALLLALKVNGTEDTLQSFSSGVPATDLSSLNPVLQDPKLAGLQIAARLTTTDPLLSPVLREWHMTFLAPPELAVSRKTVASELDHSSPQVGNFLAITVYNLGYSTADSARVSVSLKIGENMWAPLASVVSDSIPVDSARTVKVSLPAQLLPPVSNLRVEVSPAGRWRDLLADNNTVDLRLSLVSVTEPLQATIHVLSDGLELVDGDYVSKRPNIQIRLAETSGITPGNERMQFFVDNVPLTTSSPAAANNVTGHGALLSEGSQFAPELGDGNHELVVRLYRSSPWGVVDSIQRRISVNVSSEYKLLRVFNYPNPFTDHTEFTFVVTGSQAPEDAEVKIFTVTGRRIRDLRALPGSLQVGFNRIPWDGRDEQGDEIANGYYFYQLQVRGEGRTVTTIEKMARVR